MYKLAWCAVLLGLLMPANSAALADTIGSPIRLSRVEQQVNASATGRQHLKSITGGAVAPLGDGYVVAWMTAVRTSTAILARRFAADGSPVDLSDIPVSTFSPTSGYRFHPVVAPLAGGGFVVAWFGAGPGDFIGIFARRFSAAGTPLDASEFRLNSVYGDNQSMVAIAGLPNGGFVAAWSGLGPVGNGVGGGVFARRFGASGAPIDAVELRVNATEAGNHSNPSVARLTGGGFVVSWMASSPTGDVNVLARRFDSSGAALDQSDIPVNAHTPGTQAHAAVAALPGGGFVAAWQSSGQDGDSDGIFARQFAADGLPVDAADIQVNFHSAYAQFTPAIAAMPRGGFVVAFGTSEEPPLGYGGGAGIVLRRFDADGAAIGFGDMHVNARTAGLQYWPSIAMLADRETVAVVWEGRGPGDAAGIFSNRIRVRGTPVARDDRLIVPAGQSATFRPLGNDADADVGDALRLVSASVDAGVVSMFRRSLVYRAPPPESGITSARIEYMIRDRAGNFASAAIDVTITP